MQMLFLILDGYSQDECPSFQKPANPKDKESAPSPTIASNTSWSGAIQSSKNHTLWGAIYLFLPSIPPSSPFPTSKRQFSHNPPPPPPAKFPIQIGSDCRVRFPEPESENHFIQLGPASDVRRRLQTSCSIFLTATSSLARVRKWKIYFLLAKL